MTKKTKTKTTKKQTKTAKVRATLASCDRARRAAEEECERLREDRDVLKRSLDAALRAVEAERQPYFERIAALTAERDRLAAQVADLWEVVEEQECGYGDDCPDFGTRHGRCLPCKLRRALDAYQPPVEASPCCTAAAELAAIRQGHRCPQCKLIVQSWYTDGVCTSCRPPRNLSPAAREARKPPPPGELVDAVMDRVHEDVTEDQSRGEDIWLTRPRAVRGD